MMIIIIIIIIKIIIIAEMADILRGWLPQMRETHMVTTRSKSKIIQNFQYITYSAKKTLPVVWIAWKTTPTTVPRPGFEPPTSRTAWPWVRKSQQPLTHEAIEARSSSEKCYNAARTRWDLPVYFEEYIKRVTWLGDVKASVDTNAITF